MKKFILFILIFAVSLLVFAENGPHGVSRTMQGTGTVLGPEESFFVSVKNTSGDVASDGAVMILDVSEGNDYSVTTSTDSFKRPHCMMAERCASDAMCKCQTYGRMDDAIFDATNTNGLGGGGAASPDGEVFMSENFPGYVQAERTGTIDLRDNSIGIFYTLTATGSSASKDKAIFIDLR